MPLKLLGKAGRPTLRKVGPAGYFLTIATDDLAVTTAKEFS